MTTPGGRPRKSGFLSNISAALTPPIVTDEDLDKPLVTPRAVTVSTILVMLAGALFVFLGGNSLINIDRDLNTAVASYDATVQQCTATYGGIGTAAVIPAAGADDASKAANTEATNCSKITSPTVTQEMRDSASSRASLVSWVMVIIGAGALVIGWFLRSGTAWARRAAVGLVVATMILTMFLQVSNPFTMVATLLLVAAVLMSYLGKGGVYFTRTAMRRRAA